ncbi:hypothetical protein C8F01DRAFT_256580 [Mycena amicta]|nr:hypothetical protein C8F01DRAFT_256580 [Mycena amicta]
MHPFKTFRSRRYYKTRHRILPQSMSNKSPRKSLIPTKTAAQLFPADDDDDDGEPFLYEEQFESDGFYGGPQYYVTEADDVEDEHDPGHFDARTMSRSVSIDPQHQHFIVEETPTEYEPEQRGMSIDIVALDEHLEPIEEEPLHVVKEDSPRSQSPAVTNVQDVEVRADEPRLSPSWSPSLPANVPMPILADATVVDPYQPSEPSILSSTRPGLMSFLRAKQESSLFTPDGSTGGTPPALEADAEAEPPGLTQTTLVETGRRID